MQFSRCKISLSPRNSIRYKSTFGTKLDNKLAKNKRFWRFFLRFGEFFSDFLFELFLTSLVDFSDWSRYSIAGMEMNASA